MSTNTNPKVSNMTSPKSGREVANQFVITQHGKGDFIKKEVFQSYNSIIATRTAWDDGAEGRGTDIVLDETYWNYSRTTSKYRNQFLNESTEETKKKINNGLYKLANLNS